MSKPLTVLALLGAAGISTIALNDAVTFALTGEYSAASDVHGVSTMYALSGVVHGLAYLAFSAVLHARRRQVDGGSRFRRVVRSVLTVTLLTLAAGMLISTAVSLANGEVLEGGIYSMVATASFLGMFIASILLGFSLLRRRELRLASWTLVGILPGLGFTILLGALGSPWAHPAYVEVLTSFGLAFVGIAPQWSPAASRSDAAAEDLVAATSG